MLRDRPFDNSFSASLSILPDLRHLRCVLSTILLVMLPSPSMRVVREAPGFM